VAGCHPAHIARVAETHFADVALATYNRALRELNRVRLGGRQSPGGTEMAQTSRPLLPAYVIMISGILVAIIIIVLIIFIENDSATPGQIGPFIGGMSLFFGALGAWIAAFIITARNAEIEQTNRERTAEIERNTRSIEIFRSLYAEFWNTEALSRVRGWITSDEEYQELKSCLEQRIKDKNVNALLRLENLKLDLADRFLSVLTRIITFQVSTDIQRPQLQLLNHSINPSFWFTIIETKRPELHTYLQHHWQYLLDISKTPPSIRE
jgi:ABC-type multidrug transport system fused ATPase/permease subunit